MTKRQPMWNSSKAWGLVLGGMLVIGIVNIWLGARSIPDGFDDNWRWADAGLDGGAVVAPATVDRYTAAAPGTHDAGAGAGTTDGKPTPP